MIRAILFCWLLGAKVAVADGESRNLMFYGDEGDYDITLRDESLLSIEEPKINRILLEYGGVSAAAGRFKECAGSKDECLSSFLGLVVSFKLDAYYQDAIDLILGSDLPESIKRRWLPVFYEYMGSKSSLSVAENILVQHYRQGDYVAGVNLSALYFKKKEYDDSFRIVNEVMRKDARFFSREISLIVLGQHYQFGLGVEKDLKKAKDIYSNKAGMNSAAVQFLLGKVEIELGDYSTAIDILRRAAELGSSAAAQDLGIFYAKGIYVEFDAKSAMKYYFLSGQLGSAVAFHDLGLLLNRAHQFKLSKISMVLAAINGDLNARKLLSENGISFEKYIPLQSELISSLKSSGVFG